MSNETWNCPKCGKQEVTSKFCPDCGTKKPESLIWNCPNCGRKELESKFCPNCGTKKPEAKKGLTPEEMAAERARIREALLSNKPISGSKPTNKVFPIYIDMGDYLELTFPIGNLHMIEKNCSPTHMGWEQAMQYAKNLRKGGFNDWRVPTKEELELMYRMKFGFEIKENDNWFWSSTLDEEPEFAWFVNFKSGYENFNYVELNGYVRCVR